MFVPPASAHPSSVIGADLSTPQLSGFALLELQCLSIR